MADAARIIDQYAFGKNPSATMIRRQQIAMRKAGDILAERQAELATVLDELVEAHQHIGEFLKIASVLTDNFHAQLGPAVERRDALLARHGRAPDD
ncbi:hypothetical protein [Bradyrhizobium japonicum]|uniref:hypothetical protein n=1 Tax=Bradyrhizobium japonicum TaxID=375 RepID=UPI001E55E11F|nr:hypothetical protein [Bradyrhizobium japonicum]MCD9817686.1 hypothetical protein [Bradyrhizobium japonicum]MEB2672471.1 hypothetical protein [Bradyrhizobium japonicum]WRI91732.1 hypothetical protein R3F75_12725 [Bradyrhizobium japonicum]